MRMSENADRTIFIKCACHGEGMGVDYDSEDGHYYFSYWSYGLSSRKLSWRQRLRYCWEVLWKGRPFNDELILTKEGVMKLENFILSCSREKF